jgi:LacI family transcriptional regulator
MATIRDVAKQSGVSVATVSYVLNDGPRPVRPETRQRVLEVMHRLNYHPNAMARGLVRRRMHTLGVLFGLVEPEIVTNPYAAAVLQGILASAADLGYNITLFPQPWKDAPHSAAAFRDRRNDGVLVVAPVEGSDMVPSLAALGLPLVVVSAPSPVAGVPSVDVDNALGARLATEHLLSLGHTRIAHLGGDTVHHSVSVRQESFRATLAEVGVPLPPEYLVQGTYDPTYLRTLARNLLALPKPPTAIFAGNDMIAFAVMEVAREESIAVPEQLSVVGFDDIATASLVTPPLTTIRQPLATLGSRAVRLLAQRVEGSDDAPPVPPQTLETPTLVVRSTTASPQR